MAHQKSAGIAMIETRLAAALQQWQAVKLTLKSYFS
jgi:hypothetical protein